MADACFSKTKVTLSRKLKYFDEISFADRFWPCESSGINKYETGSSI